MQNSDFWTGITRVYVSQTWPFVLCKNNSVLSIRNTCLYWSQTSSVVFACKTTWLTTELLVSMVPRPHLWILTAKHRLLDQHTSLYRYQTSPVVLCMQNSVISTTITSLYGSLPSTVVFARKTVTFGPDLKVSVGPRHDLSFCACTTACLAPEILVSMGPSLHLWFLNAKQRLLDQN